MKFATYPILAAIAAACLTPFHGAVAEPVSVGAVDKVQEQAIATQSGATRDLQAAGPVYFRDRMKTGPGARLRTASSPPLARFLAHVERRYAGSGA